MLRRPFRNKLRSLEPVARVLSPGSSGLWDTSHLCGRVPAQGPRMARALYTQALGLDTAELKPISPPRDCPRRPRPLWASVSSPVRGPCAESSWEVSEVTGASQDECDTGRAWRASRAGRGRPRRAGWEHPVEHRTGSRVHDSHVQIKSVKSGTQILLVDDGRMNWILFPA